MSHRWKIDSASAGTRLDKFLVERLPEVSRSALQEFIRTGQAQVGGRQEKPGYRVRVADEIALEVLEAIPELGLKPTPMTFPVLFEDADLVAIDKPAGIAVHPGAGGETETVVSALLSHCELSSIGRPLRPGVVHRLDKGTTGVLILAKTEAAHKKLAKAFSGRRLKKEYLALVQGVVREERGVVEIAIARDRQQRKRMQAVSVQKGRMALSRFEVVERFPTATLLTVRIETGRTHQIRVHMAYIGHPLLGDVLYGGSRLFGKANHHLHSRHLGLTHPISGKPLELAAPVPAEFQETLARLRAAGAGKKP
jgi:23S rRNA pseudouridine1911/1915/1917 synthase